jgi:hypothetical protein
MSVSFHRLVDLTGGGSTMLGGIRAAPPKVCLRSGPLSNRVAPTDY